MNKNLLMVLKQHPMISYDILKMEIWDIRKVLLGPGKSVSEN